MVIDTSEIHPANFRFHTENFKSESGENFFDVLRVQEIESVGHHLEATPEHASPMIVVMKVESEQAIRGEPFTEFLKGC